MERNKFYMLSSDNSGLNGIPIYLDCRLWEHLDRKDLMEPLRKFHSWDMPGSNYEKTIFPEKLYLIAKAPKLSFDFYPYRSTFQTIVQ